MLPYNEITVVILAGGKGINFGEKGNIIPKGMVELKGYAIMLYIMEKYAQYGLRKFIICTGLKGSMIKEYMDNLYLQDNSSYLHGNKYSDEGKIKENCFRSKHREEWEIRVIDTGIDNRTGSRLSQVKENLKDCKYFCVSYADTLSDFNFEEQFQFHLNHGKMATLLGTFNPTRFRILGIPNEDGLVRGVSSRFVLQKEMINGGFYIFNPNLFDLKSLTDKPECDLETHVLEELISKKEIYAYRHYGFWQPLDNERDRSKILEYLELNK